MAQENIDNLRAYCMSWRMGGRPNLDLIDPEVVYEDDILPRHTGIETDLRSFREPEEALERLSAAGR